MTTQTSANTIRPTKKQREILTFIEQFIGEHGYSPSYREIMNGLAYTSVATVSLHINSLIRRGQLLKRDRSARSLEVIKNNSGTTADKDQKSIAIGPDWLITEVDKLFEDAEKNGQKAAADADGLNALIKSLELFGLNEAAGTYRLRLESLMYTKIHATQ